MGEVKDEKRSRRKQPVPHRLHLRQVKLLTYEDPDDCWHGFVRAEIAPGVYLASECHSIDEERLRPREYANGMSDRVDGTRPQPKEVSRVINKFVAKLRDLGYIVSEDT